ncbi:MAG: DegT/DnrJ/EryC1/StrS family aminotransferase [Gammaproteobacteria bacterium]|nr:DegT/DnrJ/EryC1/StrS family aminotransferase [Gammaproteobacteria bacterium]
MRIPFVDLHAQYLAHQEEFDAAFREVIGKTAFIGGEFVREFERAYAEAYGVKHCISCANGTDAIYIVLRMLDVGLGHEVITTAASWISTSETISQAGALPVFVDVDEYGNIDVEQVERNITPHTRAIIPVHLYGQAAQVEVLEKLAASRGVHLVEDCAQAHFAERAGRRVGTFGVAGTFSFYPGKNLGAYGDAGAIITNDDELARRCRMYANHGALVKHQHELEGINSRLDGLQASLLTAKLKYLGEWTEARRRVAGWYDQELASIDWVARPRVRPGSTHVYHLYVIQVDDRDALRAHLTRQGIETGVHYPVALPLMQAYQYLGMSASDVPNAARNQDRILSLPIYPEMTAEMVHYVVAAIRSFRG